MSKVKFKRVVLLSILTSMPMFFGSALAQGVKIGKNTQIVTVKGSVTNNAQSNSTARTNIGSVVGAQTGDNHQVISVGGSITNSAAGGSTSEINIGSVVNGKEYDSRGRVR